MIELKQEHNTLVLLDIPVGYWLSGSIMLLLMALILGARIFAIIEGNSTTFGDLVLLIITSAIFLPGIVVCGKAAMRKIRFDPVLRLITIWRRGVFLKQFSTISFEEIEGGALLRKFAGRNGKAVYSIELLLRDSNTIKLTEREEAEEGPLFNAVSSINEVLGLKVESGDFKLPLLEKD